ncbi:MAG TPA: pyridoxal phosphate-dependent aminotransferase [Acidobacteriaceae bacterium]|nr:pyridoxal phosphate-dependent aminotransferase [Acidobacteriaceae bacterium]
MKPQFSARTEWNLQATPYAAAVAALRADGKPVFDLTASNPTACGFDYDAAGIRHALSQSESLQYDPDPRGLRIARQAVARYYAEVAGIELDPDHIFLTTSTSEAYGYLFRLHCDPGAEVLIAQPSYPLVEFLADLDDVRLVPYSLFYDHGWHIDLAALESRITPKTRVIALVHPNNPTGHFTSQPERKSLEQICRRHSLALILDEVFLDYALDSEPKTSQKASFTTGEHPVLTYVLSGLSKIAGLPQMKAAWIAAFGPPELLAQASARLEVIADTFLSMNAPIQQALSYMLANRQGIQRQILVRVRENLTALDRRLRDASALSRLQAEGGWNAVLRVPVLMSGEALALRLLEQQRVIVHPGYFYGFEGDGWIVLSLLTPAAEFAEGIDRLIGSFV